MKILLLMNSAISSVLEPQEVEQVFHTTQCGENCRCLIPDQHGPVGFLGSECGDQYVIDILWSYTDAALLSLGSTSILESKIDEEINSTNLIFSNSELPFSVRSVGITPVAYDESTESHLNAIRDPNDGHADEIHAIRDELQADIVVLITETGFCGQAYLAPTSPELGFQTISAGCLGPLQVLAHELGHNLGSKHFSSDAGGFFDYSCGHVLPLPGQPGTAMGGNALPHYSNPRVSYNGVATGVPIGQSNAADNWTAFQVTGPMVAKFRCSDDCNGNGIPDGLDIDSGFSEDCDQNTVPDECQPGDPCKQITVLVPEDYSTISGAVQACPNGSTVMVGPGNWQGNIIISGKSINLVSKNGPETTNINSGSWGIKIIGSQSDETVVEGFTIAGFSVQGDGGGVEITDSDPKVENCFFEDNTASYAGGAIRVTECSPIVSKCSFKNNVSDYGGAISVYAPDDTPQILNCTFTENNAYGGGAISNWDSSSFIEGCRFERNNATINGAVLVAGSLGHQISVSDSSFVCNGSGQQITPGGWIDLGGSLVNDCDTPGACCISSTICVQNIPLDCHLADGFFQVGECDSNACDFSCTGDLTIDGTVGVQDLIFLLSSWDTEFGDLNQDGTTNYSDLLRLISAWGPCE